MISLIANTIRGLVADMVEKAKSGHPGMPLGTAEIATILYSEFLSHDPTTPEWPNRDRFILSAGHGSTLQYAILHIVGYPLPLDQLKQFRQLGSLTPGHPEHGVTSGIETTTGPLGQGFGNAVGMALAEQMLTARFNQPNLEIMNHYTYVIAGDGCMMEGITSEAASLAGNLGLGKLIVFYDDNEISIEGSTDIAFKENVAQRFSAYGWDVLSIDGHNPDQIRQAIQNGKANLKQPTLIIAKTTLAQGSPLAGNAEAHGSPLGKENVISLKKTLGLPPEDFYVPQAVYDFFAEMRKQWQDKRIVWETQFDKWSKQYPNLRQEWERIMKQELPSDLLEKLPKFDINIAVATRDAGGKVLNALSAQLPELVGGSADLSPSTKTYLNGEADIKAGEYAGKNLHFGVREHAMGSILNGLTLHGGFHGFGSTFLVFTDYMRPAVRLASLMKLPVIYVYTHDSIYVGEDGPTHQPIEQIESLRIIPGLTVIRPADANETAWAWLNAIKKIDGPTAIILTRQKLPTLAETSYDGFCHGGYIVKDAITVRPDLVILATGSEVSLAIETANLLELQRGLTVRVVSVPCREIFLKQSKEYLQTVLGNAIPRIAIEAGVTSGWHQLVGPDGLVIGIDSFGKSGPAEEVGKLFGLTAEQIVARITY